MPMQIRRTVTPNNPPTGLAEGQLSVEMGSTPPKLWAGVPTSVDPSGRILLNGATGVTISDTAPANPQVADVWFNSTDLQAYIWYDDGNSEQWVPINNQQGGIGLFLELAGGTMVGPLTLAGDATQPLNPVTLQQMKDAIGAPMHTGPTAPPPPNEAGDLWLNTGDNQLYVYDGSGWVLSVTPPSGFLPLTGGNLSGMLVVGSGSTPTVIASNGIASQAGNFNTLATSVGILYQYSLDSIGFSWHTGSPGEGLWAYINGVQNGLVVRSGLGTSAASALTGTDQIGIRGTDSTTWLYYQGGFASWTVSLSDRRLKENTKPASVDALSRINALNVYETDLHIPSPGGETQHWDCSLMADELDGVIPHARVRALDGQEGAYESVNTYPLVATLIKAVQELSAEMKALKETRHGLAG